MGRVWLGSQMRLIRAIKDYCWPQGPDISACNVLSDSNSLDHSEQKSELSPLSFCIAFCDPILRECFIQEKLNEKCRVCRSRGFDRDKEFILCRMLQIR